MFNLAPSWPSTSTTVASLCSIIRCLGTDSFAIWTSKVFYVFSRWLRCLIGGTRRIRRWGHRRWRRRGFVPGRLWYRLIFQRRFKRWLNNLGILEQLTYGLEQIRATIGTVEQSGLTDREIKDTLYNFYYDIEQSLNWIFGEPHMFQCIT